MRPAKIFTIKVKTNAKRNEVLSIDHEKNEATIAVKALPEKGEANRELIKFLSKEWKKRVRILSGLTSKTKKVVRDE